MPDQLCVKNIYIYIDLKLMNSLFLFVIFMMSILVRF